MILKYTFSSISSCALDLVLFTVFCRVLKGRVAGYVALATVPARIISAVYNYCMNHKFVFRSTERMRKSSVKYFTLAAVQMGLSATLVTIGTMILPAVSETAVKLVVDVFLFFISYMIQRRFIFLRDETQL